jgi:hypothetical protein
MTRMFRRLFWNIFFFFLLFLITNGWGISYSSVVETIRRRPANNNANGPVWRISSVSRVSNLSNRKKKSTVTNKITERIYIIYKRAIVYYAY